MGLKSIYLLNEESEIVNSVVCGVPLFANSVVIIFNHFCIWINMSL